MTREEAWNRIDAIIEKHEVDDVYVTINNHKDYDALRFTRKLLEQEPCEDAIGRSDMLDAIGHGTTYTSEELQRIIKGLPPVTSQQKIGHWIDDKCSVCEKGIEDLIDSREWYRNEEPNFCPFCGAKMVETQERSEQ